jgi:hypothetical protein
MLLDHLAQDEEESIRLVAVKTMSYYLQDPIIRCDVLTRNRFLQFLCSECDDVDDLLESLLDRLEVVKFGSVQDALKPTLFDPEDLNTFKESIVDVFMVSGCLEKLSTRLSSDKITGRLQQLVQEFLQLSTMPDFNWLTNSAQVFDLGLQAIASAHLLSTFGDSDPLAKLAALKMHPFLKQIVDRNQWNSTQWYFLIK